MKIPQSISESKKKKVMHRKKMSECFWFSLRYLQFQPLIRTFLQAKTFLFQKVMRKNFPFKKSSLIFFDFITWKVCKIRKENRLKFKAFYKNQKIKKLKIKECGNANELIL